jgi:hypothetical protein
MSSGKSKPKTTCAARNRDYKRRVREFRENNLHPESIAMENPQFIPKIISPPKGESTIIAEDWEMPFINGMPIYIQTSSDQGLENPTVDENIELPSTNHIR